MAWRGSRGKSRVGRQSVAYQTPMVRPKQTPMGLFQNDEGSQWKPDQILFLADNTFPQVLLNALGGLLRKLARFRLLGTRGSTIGRVQECELLFEFPADAADQQMSAQRQTFVQSQSAIQRIRLKHRGLITTNREDVPNSRPPAPHGNSSSSSWNQFFCKQSLRASRQR